MRYTVSAVVGFGPKSKNGAGFLKSRYLTPELQGGGNRYPASGCRHTQIEILPTIEWEISLSTRGSFGRSTILFFLLALNICDIHKILCAMSNPMSQCPNAWMVSASVLKNYKQQLLILKLQHLRRFRSDLTRSLLKERDRWELKRLKNRL